MNLKIADFFNFETTRSSYTTITKWSKGCLVLFFKKLFERKKKSGARERDSSQPTLIEDPLNLKCLVPPLGGSSGGSQTRSTFGVVPIYTTKVVDRTDLHYPGRVA
ncbi:Uncharacterized protein Fot_41742 [Forsythia ovata]|uniref:Uncharacterized protein n=1 Tax=Forsythia ovata TaxID=205694 RepID=A0ABD1RJ72_9LAMI